MFPDEDIWGHALFMLEYVSISGSEYKKIKYVAEEVLKILFKYLSCNTATRYPLTGLENTNKNFHIGGHQTILILLNKRRIFILKSPAKKH